MTAQAHLAFWFVLSSKEDVSISCENLIWRTSPSSDKYDRRYDGIIIPGYHAVIVSVSFSAAR